MEALANIAERFGPEWALIAALCGALWRLTKMVDTVHREIGEKYVDKALYARHVENNHAETERSLQCLLASVTQLVQSLDTLKLILDERLPSHGGVR